MAPRNCRESQMTAISDTRTLSSVTYCVHGVGEGKIKSKEAMQWTPTNQHSSVVGSSSSTSAKDFGSVARHVHTVLTLLPPMLHSAMLPQSQSTMPLHRTDSAAAKAAQARRKQRTTSKDLSERLGKVRLLEESSAVAEKAAAILSSARKARSERQSTERSQKELHEKEPRVSSSSTDLLARLNESVEDRKPARLPPSVLKPPSRGVPTTTTAVLETPPKTLRVAPSRPAAVVDRAPVLKSAAAQQPFESAVQSSSPESPVATTPSSPDDDPSEEEEDVWQQVLDEADDVLPTVVTVEEMESATTGRVDAATLQECFVWRWKDRYIGADLQVGDQPCVWKRNVDDTLRYGTRMTLQCTEGGYYLGVRSVETEDQQRQQVVVGPAVHDSWTVLRVRPKVPVRLSSSKDSAKGGPIQSGDLLVVRHDTTGGILAVDPDTQALCLRTDSHDPDQVRHADEHDPSLMGRLYRHGTIVPGEWESFCFLLPCVPPAPLWVWEKRLFLTRSYLTDPKRHEASFKDTTNLPNGEELRALRQRQLQTPLGQEQLLVEELLGAFAGLEGSYVQTNHSEDMERMSFRLVHSKEVLFTKSLRLLAEELVPLATSFARVQHFVNSHLPGYEYGQAMHGLCEVLDEIVREYLAFLASIELDYRSSEGEGSYLRRLQVAVRPWMRTMVVLQKATDAARPYKGGALINALWQLKRSAFDGDAIAGPMLDRMIAKASGPYMKALEEWLSTGALVDPYHEFMVSYNRHNPWDTRYALVDENILLGFFASETTIQQAMDAGKYWNSLQKWRKRNAAEAETSGDDREPLSFASSIATVASFVQRKYREASRILVRVLTTEFDLIQALRVMKRYFLLDQGDFFVHFLDSAEVELRKNVDHISYGRVQHWLSLAVQLLDSSDDSSETQSTVWSLKATSLRCRFAPESLLDRLDKLHEASGGIDTQDAHTPQRHMYGSMSGEGLTGLESFLLEFASIPFPLSLVLSQKSLGSYQLLFRHLFFAKHVERSLVSIWQDHQAMKELQSLRGSLGPTFLLRQRMLHFVQNLIYYMMFEIIGPNWLEMERGIANAVSGADGTIEDILDVHSLFLEHTLEACLLTNRDVVRALTKLLSSCLLFSDQMALFFKTTRIDTDRKNVAVEKQKLVQRSLNDRGGGRASLSRTRLHQVMQASREERQHRVRRQTTRVQSEISSDSYRRMISRFDEVFTDNLRDFMLQLAHSDDLYHTHKVNLCVRLDYNGFVTETVGLKK